jgi:hypothetical protein
MSLMKILDDPSLLFDGERLKKIAGEVKKDKNTILKSAEEYNNKHKQEIEEGTLKRKLMIEDGVGRGLKEEDVCRGSFVPTKYTPILNWLYFLMKEENVDVGWEESRQKYNKQYGHLVDDYEEQTEVPEMDELIYGSCSHDMFKKIKKLKALSRSSNKNESFIAYKMCLELCKKYGLEMDKIPCNV